MTKLQMLNGDFANLDLATSVSPDGIGYDIHEVSSGDYVANVDNLDEAWWLLVEVQMDQERMESVIKFNGWHQG